MATQLRKALRRRRQRLPLALAHEMTLTARESFRHGIHGTLVLPPLLARLVA
jgi:hypothetical protein